MMARPVTMSTSSLTFPLLLLVLRFMLSIATNSTTSDESPSPLKSVEELLSEILVQSNVAASSNITSLNLSRHQIKGWKSDSFNPVSSFTIESLNLSYNSLSPSLPKSGFKLLKKLKILDLSSNGLKSLDRNDFLDLVQLMHLNLSFNSLSKLPSNVFSRNAQLTSINLSFNNFSEVDSYFLKPLRFLREINFNSNQIKTIARKAFASNTRIRKVHLRDNQLQVLYKDMFSGFSLLELLDLSHNQITMIDAGSFQKLSSVSLDLSHNQIGRLTKSTFVDVNNLETLNLSHNNLSFIHDEAFDYSDCTNLLLQFNQIKNASAIPLTNLTSIKTLNVSHNQIEIIDRKSLTKVKLYEMASIDLSHNQIKTLTGNKFELFWALRFLDLSYNSLKKLSSGSFGSNIPTLLELNLNNNQLVDVSTGAINGLISVKTLNFENNLLKRVPTIPIAVNLVKLSNNSISSISCSSFPMMNSLLFMDMSFNNLSKFETDSFCNLLTLRSLDLSHNSISNVNEDLSPAISKLASLQDLDLSYNLISTLNTSDTFGVLPSLFNLNLSSNSIKDLAPFTFNGLIQLQSLVLSNNSLNFGGSNSNHNPSLDDVTLSGVTLDSFKGLVSLKELDLRSNSLNRLGNRTHSLFEELLSLEFVDLSSNRISFITKKSFPSSPWTAFKLRKINLSHNLIESIVNYEGLQTIEELDLCSNHVRKLIPGSFGNFSSLKSLNLSNNRISVVGLNSFSPLKSSAPGDVHPGTRSKSGGSSPPSASTSLEQLDLSFNHISSFDPQEMLSLQSLKQINLIGNPLNEFPCISQVTARMERKGLFIQFNHSSSSDAIYDRKHEDAIFCNNWISKNFRIQSSSSSRNLKLVVSSSSSASASLSLITILTCIFWHLAL